MSPNMLLRYKNWEIPAGVCIPVVHDAWISFHPVSRWARTLNSVWLTVPVDSSEYDARLGPDGPVYLLRPQPLQPQPLARRPPRSRTRTSLPRTVWP